MVDSEVTLFLHNDTEVISLVKISAKKKMNARKKAKRERKNFLVSKKKERRGMKEKK